MDVEKKQLNVRPRQLNCVIQTLSNQVTRAQWREEDDLLTRLDIDGEFFDLNNASESVLVLQCILQENQTGIRPCRVINVGVSRNLPACPCFCWIRSGWQWSTGPASVPPWRSACRRSCADPSRTACTRTDSVCVCSPAPICRTTTRHCSRQSGPRCSNPFQKLALTGWDRTFPADRSTLRRNEADKREYSQSFPSWCGFHWGSSLDCTGAPIYRERKKSLKTSPSSNDDCRFTHLGTGEYIRKTSWMNWSM